MKFMVRVMSNARQINIVVAYANEKRQVEIPIVVETNCTVAVAIRRCGILDLFPEIQLSTAVIGIHSKKVPLDASLSNDDRIEIYRPLQIDPKQARRKRAMQ